MIYDANIDDDSNGKDEDDDDGNDDDVDVNNDKGDELMMNEEDKTATKTVTSILDFVAVRNLKYDTVCQWANKLSEFRQTLFPKQL